MKTTQQLTYHGSTIQLSQNLQELIQLKAVNRICIIQADQPHSCPPSQHWCFYDDLVQIDDQLYSLHQILTFSVSDQVLALYL